MANDPEVISICSQGSSVCLCTKQKVWYSVVPSVGEGLEDITRDSGLGM